MNISQRLRTCAKHTGLDAVIELLTEAADEIDALQARALRPERVPMKDLPEGDVTYFDGRGNAFDGYTAERVWEILRSHGITSQAKKEGE